jgi:hypothetical protein
MNSRIGLVILLFGFWIISSCAGASINVVPVEDLDSSVSEDQKINFTIMISNYPHNEGYNLSISTSLLNTGNDPSFNLFSLNEPNKNVNLYKREIIIPVPSQNKFTVQVTGEVPSVVARGEMTGLTKYSPGPYSYYDIKLLDQNGNVIDRGEIETYTVNIKEIEDFDKKLQTVTAPEFEDIKDLLKDLHDNVGAVSESDALTDALIVAQNQLNRSSEEENHIVIWHYTIFDIVGVFVIGLGCLLLGYYLRGDA